MRHKTALVSEEELPSWLLKDVEELEQMEYEENEGRLFGLGREIHVHVHVTCVIKCLL